MDLGVERDARMIPAACELDIYTNRGVPEAHSVLRLVETDEFDWLREQEVVGVSDTAASELRAAGTPRAP